MEENGEKQNKWKGRAIELNSNINNNDKYRIYWSDLEREKKSRTSSGVEKVTVRLFLDKSHWNIVNCGNLVVDTAN